MQMSAVRLVRAAFVGGICLVLGSCVTPPEPDYGLEAVVLSFDSTTAGAATPYFELKDARSTVRLVSLVDATGRAFDARVTSLLASEDGSTLTTRALSGLNVLGDEILPPTVLYAGFSLRASRSFTFEFDDLTAWQLDGGQAQLRVFLLWWELLEAQPPLTALVEVMNPDE